MGQTQVRANCPPPQSASAAAAAAPRWRWHSVGTFTALAAAALQTHVLVFSFQMSTITTIQKLYGLSTFKVGLLFGIYEVGEISAGVLGSYFASRSRKPRVVAGGLLLAALACLLFASPHFIFTEASAGPAAAAGAILASGSSGRATVASCTLQQAPSFGGGGSGGEAAANFSTTEADQCGGGGEVAGVADVVMAIYALANVLLGVGYSPIATLVVVYIDDNAISKSKASFYQSAFYMVHYIGYIVGYGVAAGALSIHTSLSPVDITPNDDNWVGAWWLGFAVCAILHVLFSATLFFFPTSLEGRECTEDGEKNLVQCRDQEPQASVAEADDTVIDEMLSKPERDNDAIEVDDYKEELPSPRELLPTVWAFIKNPLYILTVLTRGTVSFIDAGYFLYLPKYLETQFHQSAAMADLQTGLAGSLVSMWTVFLGGWVLSRYKLTLTQCTAMVFLSYLIGTALFVVASFFSCPQNLASSHVVHDIRYNCSGADYQPVCINHTTYFSPCHGGCQNTTTDSDGRLVFTGCFCSAASNASVSAVEGGCHEECNSLIVYLAMVMVAYSIPSFSAMATITILLRCVKRDQRSFSLGIYNASLSALAWIPSPMLYGAAVDMTCLTWGSGSQDCEGHEEQGACSQYDNTRLRIWIHSLTCGSLALGSILGAGTWALARRGDGNAQRHAATLEMKRQELDGHQRQATFPPSGQLL